MWFTNYFYKTYGSLPNRNLNHTVYNLITASWGRQRDFLPAYSFTIFHIPHYNNSSKYIKNTFKY